MFGNINKPAFGSAAPSTSFAPSLFGQQQPAAGGLFNTGSTTAFGQQHKPAFGFGTTQPQQSLFGAQQPQATNVFQPSAGGLFSSGPGFGAQQQTGTVIKFTPITGTDTMMKNGVSQSINTKHHSITCMKEYEKKSFEELRLEDYEAGRKGFGMGAQPQNTASPFGAKPTGFGAPTTSTFAFGGPQQNVNPFGATSAAKPFGAAAQPIFSTSSTPQTTGFGSSLFGTNTQVTGSSLFNKPAQAAPAFGAPSTTGFAFNTPASTQSTNLFSNNANKPLFGTPSTTTGFGTNTFGAAQPAFGSTFGKPAATPFGATQQTTFGTTLGGGTAFGTNTFGTAQPAFGSTFGKPAATPFGTTQPTTSGTTLGGFGTNTFGTAQPAFGSTFGKPAATPFGTTQPTTAGATLGFGTNTFGATQPAFGNTFKPAATPFGAPQQTTFGTTLGGGMTNTGTSLFGTNNQIKPGGSLFNTGTTGLFANTNTGFQTNTGFGLGQQQQPQQMLFAPQEVQSPGSIALMTSGPFGDAPHLAGLEPKLKTDIGVSVSATNPKELKSLLDASKKVDVTPNSKLKVTPFKSIKNSLFEGLPKADESSKQAVGEENVKNSCRRLVLKPRQNSDTNSPSYLRHTVIDSIINNDKENISGGKKSMWISPELNKVNPQRLNFDLTNDLTTILSNSKEAETSNVVNTSTTVDNFTDARDIPQQINIDNDEYVDVSAAGGDVTANKYPCGIICTRPEYYTKPEPAELEQYLDVNGACFVKGFVVGRKGYGNVYFYDELNIAGLNIDELVHFRYREINVYPDDSKKPPVGEGLNRKAQVTLDNVYPRKNGTHVLIKDITELVHMNFAEKLRKVTEKKCARFVDYRPETGSWVFKVDHFSRYSFNDSDEENDENGKAPLKELDKTSDKLKQPVVKDSTETLKEPPQKIEDKLLHGEMISTSLYSIDKDILVDNDDEIVGLYNSQVDIPKYSVDISDDDFRHQLPDMSMDIGYSAYKASKNIQVMKSTLFADDDRMSDDGTSQVSIMKQYLDLPEDIPRLPIISEEEVSVRKRPVLRPKVYKTLNLDAEETLMPSRCCLDIGLFKGKSYKAGWRRGFQYLQPSNEFRKELELKTSLKRGGCEEVDDILTDCLHIVLEESSLELNDAHIPTFQIIKGHSFLQRQTSLFENLSNRKKSPEVNYMYSIWTLCQALWGAGDSSIDERLFLLSEWLKVNTSRDEVSLRSQSPITEITNAIFSHLSVFELFDAADVAMIHRLPNLSMIMSQVSLTNNTKMFLQEQIENWYSSLTSEHVSDEMKRIYLLLSGIPVRDTVNVFNGIDWKRAFGMHMWYICPTGAPIEMIIEQYNTAFRDLNYAAGPNPPYLSEISEYSAYDILYHILMLYRTNAHRLSSVLNPATHTEDPLDYRLSWLLLQLFTSLDVGIIETAEINKISTSFSNQLENAGHWEWAIFALLYMRDDSIKKQYIMSILDRNLTTNTSDKELQSKIDNVVSNMQIPPEWIHHVKAEKYVSEDKYFEAFHHFTLAGDYIRANELLIQHILPRVFINEQFDLLKSLIESVMPGSDAILRWNNEAGLFYEFLELQEKNLPDHTEEIVKLQTQLISISNRIMNFPLTTDQQKLCVAELSKRCASLYKELFKSAQQVCATDAYTHFIQALIMPPDFKQHEGLYLINTSLCGQ